VKDIAEDTGAYAIVVKEIKLHVAEFPEVKFIHERCLTSSGGARAPSL
jgi:hypothetical protein